MSNTKTLKGRVINKHKTAAEWYLDAYTAADSTTLREDPFIPYDGELIIYDPEPDSGYPEQRIKIGDGVHNVVALTFYQGDPVELLTENKTLVGAINEISRQTINGVEWVEQHARPRSISYDEGQGFIWQAEERMMDEDDEQIVEYSRDFRLPLVSGDGVELEIDEDNQLIRVNSQVVTEVATQEDIPDNTTGLYRYTETIIEEDEEISRPSHLVEVVTQTNNSAEDGGSLYKKITTTNNTQLSTAEAVSGHFDVALANLVTFGATIKNVYTFYNVNVPELNGIRVGTKKHGQLSIVVNKDCNIILGKYPSINTSTTPPTITYDEPTFYINTLTHTFPLDSTTMSIALTPGEYVFETNINDTLTGRILLLGVQSADGEVISQFVHYELARIEDVDNAVEIVSNRVGKLEQSTADLKTKVTAVENKLPTIESKIGTVQIWDVRQLPAANAKQINNLYRHDGTLHQCVAGGDGEQKIFNFNLPGTSEITAAHYGADGTLYSEIGQGFKNYLNFCSLEGDDPDEYEGVTKVYRNGDSFKLGSSSATGRLAFKRRDYIITEKENTIEPPEAITALSVGLRAYNAKQSRFHIACGTITKDVTVTDTTTETLVGLYPEEGQAFGDVIVIETVASVTSEDGEGNPTTTTFDNRGLVTRLLVDFGEVTYEWKPISGAATESYSEGLAYTLSEDSTYYSVSGIGTCEDKIVRIPPTHKGIPVTVVGLENNGSIDMGQAETLIIPNSVTLIKDGAFYIRNNLTKVFIPASVTTIVSSISEPGITFYCEAASKPSGWYEWWYGGADINDVVWGVTDDFLLINEKIGSISKLETNSDNLVDAINKINGKVSGYSGGLEFILNSDGGSYTVSKGSCVDTNIIIPKIHNGMPVTDIHAYTFNNVSSLESIFIPNSITVIPSYAFQECYALTIYCEVESKQEGWDTYWNSIGPRLAPVVWGFANDFIAVNEKINAIGGSNVIDVILDENSTLQDIVNILIAEGRDYSRNNMIFVNGTQTWEVRFSGETNGSYFVNNLAKGFVHESGDNYSSVNAYSFYSNNLSYTVDDQQIDTLWPDVTQALLSIHATLGNISTALDLIIARNTTILG